MPPKQAHEVVVLGASGFVGHAVVKALVESGHTVTPWRGEHVFDEKVLPSWSRVPERILEETVERLSVDFRGATAVVNAAGDPDASSRDHVHLLTVNALLPVLALRAAQRAGVQRFVHVSSAVVQGDLPTLDSTDQLQPFSAYSHSKALAERWLQADDPSPTRLVIYRPPSVHAPDRAVSRKIAALAAGPLRSVAGRGDQQTPQALLENVASAIAFLTTCVADPPVVVHHPWEGLTAAGLLRTLGGKEPRHLPRPVASSLVGGARAVERIVPAIAANRRRVQLLWFGQDVAESWLTSAGWAPPQDLESWRRLASAPHSHDS